MAGYLELSLGGFSRSSGRWERDWIAFQLKRTMLHIAEDSLKHSNE